MAGPAFHLRVLRQTIDALTAAGDPRGPLMDAHLPYAQLGALGPDLLRYQPVGKAVLDKFEEKGLSGLEPLELLELRNGSVMAAYALVFPALLQVLPVLEALHDFLDKLDQIAADEDEDALKEMEDELNAIQQQVSGLSAVLQGTTIQTRIGELLVLRPHIQGAANPNNTPAWRPVELLRWRGTGKLAQKLLELANAEGDATARDQLRAYAYGYLCHTAASVSGEPFVNNVTGGPYRTHWWRTRLVSQFVDAWTFGRYATPASMQGDEPSPSYGEWKNLVCEGNLHDAIRFDAGQDGRAAVQAIADREPTATDMPAALAKLIVESIRQTYPAQAIPQSVTEDTVRRAYHVAFGVLWFMTSGVKMVCVARPGPPPSNCTDPPEWLTNGQGPPATPTEASDTSTGSGIVAAILAILAILTGQWLLGLGAIGFAIGAALAGDDVDWEAFRCNLYWIRRGLLFETENLLRGSLVAGALVPPMNYELGTVQPDGNMSPTSAVTQEPMCKTRRLAPRYPFQMDATVVPPNGTQGLPDLNYLKFPQSDTEQPLTFDLPNPDTYPDSVIDAAGLLNGGVRTDNPATFPSRNQDFGGAVANAVDLIQADGAGLANYNLDGDRGYGWKAWQPQANTFPGSGTVNAEPAG